MRIQNETTLDSPGRSIVKAGLLLSVLTVLAAGPAQASITNVTCASDGYVWAVYAWDNYDHMSFSAHQYDGVAGMTGSIFTDSPVDPTLIIGATIDNDTSFSWTGYHINVSMNQFFTLSSPTALNPGWTANITAQPVLSGGSYVGQVDYLGGNPVGIGQILSFGYRITFEGATQYTFGQDLMPVPEPGSVALLAAGLMSIVTRRCLRRNHDLS